MDEFTNQLDQFRRLMTDDVRKQLDALGRIDQALIEADNQVLDYLDGMFRRHNERRSQIIARLIEEARRYQVAMPADNGFGAALESSIHAPRFLGGGSMQPPAPNETEAAAIGLETWNGSIESYGGWRQ